MIELFFYYHTPCLRYVKRDSVGVRFNKQEFKAYIKGRHLLKYGLKPRGV